MHITPQPRSLKSNRPGGKYIGRFQHGVAVDQFGDLALFKSPLSHHRVGILAPCRQFVGARTAEQVVIAGPGKQYIVLGVERRGVVAPQAVVTPVSVKHVVVGATVEPVHAFGAAERVGPAATIDHAHIVVPVGQQPDVQRFGSG